MTDYEAIAADVYGALSVEPSTVLVEAVIRYYNERAWSTGPVPGDTEVLVKTDSGTYIASFNAGRWVLQGQEGLVLEEPVTCWRALP